MAAAFMEKIAISLCKYEAYSETPMIRYRAREFQPWSILNSGRPGFKILAKLLFLVTMLLNLAKFAARFARQGPIILISRKQQPLLSKVVVSYHRGVTVTLSLPLAVGHAMEGGNEVITAVLVAVHCRVRFSAS